VTNVAPLPDKVARKLYAEREEDMNSIRRFIAAQPNGKGSNRGFAPRGAGAWAALARSGLLPAWKKWRSRRASCWLTLTSFVKAKAESRKLKAES